MRDEDCVDLLRWILPRLSLRWAGFRRVRRQVCKRFARRLTALGLDTVADYRSYLADHPEEWARADALCRVTISHFYRGKELFAFLGANVMPGLGRRAAAAGRKTLRVWSAGCSSGEEPYSLALLWHYEACARLNGMNLSILATDIDATVLERAERAVYPPGCLKNLPEAWRAEAFVESAGDYRLREAFKAAVYFRRHDIRQPPPAGHFDLLLCRNLAFTYFADALQVATARQLGGALREGGALVLGSHERLPEGSPDFVPWSESLRVYSRIHATGP